MAERRGKTGPDSVGLGHSFADDNVERGSPDVDFIKRRPTYPLGDDPRGREIDFESDLTSIFRNFRGQAPLEGQDPKTPVRVGSLSSLKDLRPELPPKSVDFNALEAAKQEERQILMESDFSKLFPQVIFLQPGGGSTFSSGQRITIGVRVFSLYNIQSAALFVDGRAVDRRVLDRRDQDVAKEVEFFFTYDIPSNRSPGAMDITVRAFSITNAAQGIIADDAINSPPKADNIQVGVGSMDGRLIQNSGSEKANPIFDTIGVLRTPDAVSSIIVFIV